MKLRIGTRGSALALAQANDTARDAWFRRTMTERGVFMVPTALKRNHVSAAHTDADIDRTLELAREVLRQLPA